MEDLTTKQSTAIVLQQNELITSHYSMSLIEKRLIVLGLSKIDFTKVANPNAPYTFDITADEWNKIFPTSNAKNTYRDLRIAADKILNRKIHLEANKDRASEKIINWLDSAEYFKKEGRITITFSFSVSIFIVNMFQGFTSYNLENISGFTSFYSIRIYELCHQFIKDASNQKAYYTVSVDKLRKILGLENKFKLYGDFKRSVLIPSVNEINTLSNIQIKMEEIYIGKKVDMLRFTPVAGRQIELLTNEGIKENE